MDTTRNLAMPLLMASQAQKHVTHNEALRQLDFVVQLSVASRAHAAPPSAPAEGERFIVGAGATGAWSGQDGRIAALQDGAWVFLAPKPGWLAWVLDEGRLVVRRDGVWAAAAEPLNPVPLVGVNATADASNRLAVASPASLFNHAGAGHQVKVNKNGAADTASLLLQTGFSGRAEIGLAGDDHLAIKVSGDGAAWTEALAVNPANGNIGLAGLRNASSRLQLAENRAGPLEALSLRNASASADAVLRLRLANDASEAGLSLNSSTRVSGGGAGGLTLFNDAGALHLRGAGAVSLLSGSGAVVPASDNAATLGSASARWSAVWAANGTIQTSDGREKRTVGSLAAFSAELVDAVDPVLFRWRDGGAEPVRSGHAGEGAPQGVRRPGLRLHAGVVAQDLKRAMDAAKVDFGAWGLEDRHDPDSRQWVRPDQLVFVLWSALRRTRAEVVRLDALVTAAIGAAERRASEERAKEG